LLLNIAATLVVVETSTLRTARRPRDFVRVSGPEAEDYLQRMLSQDVSVDPGESREALLLTAKARVIAPMTVLRRGVSDFLLSIESGLGDRVAGELRRSRFAARVEIEPETHDAVLVFTGDRPGGIAYQVHDYGEPAWEILDTPLASDGQPLDDAALEILRIEAGTPRSGRELDDRVLPAEAGLTERAVSLTKGCYPGQEPVARLHYRGHVNRRLRVLDVDGDVAPETEVVYEDKVVGRVTSAAGGVALAYVRTEVPESAELVIGAARARLRP
jgi:folate-binding protein YgfZ